MVFWLRAAMGMVVLLGIGACAPLALDSAEAGGPSQQGGGLSTSAVGTRTLMDEHFAHAWPDKPGGTAWFTADGYRLYARHPGDFVAVRAPLADVPRDAIVSATFRKVGGPPGGGYGLIVRDQGVGAGDGVDQSGQYIVAAVSDRGEAGIWRRDGQRWIDLIPWSPAGSVRPNDKSNDLTVQLAGDRLTYLINGNRIASIDIGLKSGHVGAFTGGDLNDVVLAHFRVEAPGRVAPAGAPAQPAAKGAAPPPAPEQRAPPSSLPDVDDKLKTMGRMRDLLTGIADDVLAIFGSFSGGIDSATSPVNDPAALRDAAARLESARGKAEVLATEVQSIEGGRTDGR
jgi:hypothetical protein